MANLALRSVLRRPTRAATAIAGVALAIALAVTMFSLSEGVRASTRDLVTQSGVDLFLYAQGTNPLLEGNPNAPAGELAHGRDLASRIANETGVAGAAPMLHKPVFALAHGRVSDANTLGFIPRTTAGFNLPAMTRGHALTDQGDPMWDAGGDPRAATGEIVLNENLARILGVGPGDEVRLSLSPSAPTNDLTFHVVGITAPDFESPQEKTVYLHLSELQYVTGNLGRDAVDFIGVKLLDARQAQSIGHDLAAKYPVAAFSNEDLVGQVGQLTSTFEGFARMIGIVTLAVALLFVSSIMILVVNERTQELGALRALGVGRRRIFATVLAEAAILVGVAALLGFALGWAGALGFDAYLRAANATRTPAAFHFTKISWSLLFEVSGLTALLALLAGLLPAWRASRVDVLCALRSG